MFSKAYGDKMGCWEREKVTKSKREEGEKYGKRHQFKGQSCIVKVKRYGGWVACHRDMSGSMGKTFMVE